MEENEKMKNEQEFYGTPRELRMTLKSMYIARNACGSQAEELQSQVDKMIAKADRLKVVEIYLTSQINKIEEKKEEELHVNEEVVE